jgi:hypothetical protein
MRIGTWNGDGDAWASRDGRTLGRGPPRSRTHRRDYRAARRGRRRAHRSHTLFVSRLDPLAVSASERSVGPGLVTSRRAGVTVNRSGSDSMMPRPLSPSASS